MTTPAHILLVEDEPLILQNLCQMLERAHYTVSLASTLAEARTFLANKPHLVVTDVRLPDGQGLDLIEEFFCIPVLVMTSFGDTRDAVNAMQRGAVDYLIKPFDHLELLMAVRRYLPNFIQQGVNTYKMLGVSPSMVQVFEQIDAFAPVDAPVLILGESGTGKELVARALHDQSTRVLQPMISVNCAAMTDSLIEDELFGHAKGAFTGATTDRKGLIEAAHQSTLFLDEIGELSLEAQARLLRVLQEYEIRRVGSVDTIKVDFRLITATHRNLLEMVQARQFREDLYFRISVLVLPVPALREREHDVLGLAQYFVKQFSQKYNKPLLHLTEEAEAKLLAHSWPGNVRELQNVLEHAVITARGMVLMPDMLKIIATPNAVKHLKNELMTPYVTPLPGNAAPLLKSKSGAPLLNDTSVLPTDLLLNETQEPHHLLHQQFIDAVRRYEVELNETQLAEKLGISRKTLWEKRQRFNIMRQPKRKNA